MIVEPELLLLDKLFGALDERTREGMQQLLLNAVRETGCSVIFVTHDVGEAILLADRLVLLSSRPGRILSTYEVTAKKPRSREFLRSEEFRACTPHCWISSPRDRGFGSPGRMVEILRRVKPPPGDSRCAVHRGALAVPLALFGYQLPPPAR